MSSTYDLGLVVGPQGEQGPQGLQGPQGIQGPQGLKGDTGDPFAIAKIYASVSAMNAGYSTDGVKIGGFVLIDTGSVEDPDTGKLYCKGNTAYTYITDLSGSQGIQGPRGPQGVQGATGPQGPAGPTGPKGDTGDQGIQGATGPKGSTGTRGSLWYRGTAITGTSATATVFSGSGITSALVNDMYLNTSTSYVYTCTVEGAASVAKWVYSGTIKGNTGATGAKGDKGDTGATGPRGYAPTLTINSVGHLIATYPD